MAVKQAFSLEQLGHIRIVHVLVDVDLSNAKELSAALDQAAGTAEGPVILSFVECRYVDSSCLAVVLRHQRSLGKRLQVVALPGSQVRRILEICGLDRAIAVREGFQEAIRSTLGSRQEDLEAISS